MKNPTSTGMSSMVARTVAPSTCKQIVKMYTATGARAASIRLPCDIHIHVYIYIYLICMYVYVLQRFQNPAL